MASPFPSLLEKQDHLTNSGADSVLSDPDSLQVSYTEAEEKALVRKLDWALIPGLTFLYLLSFLDRSNGQSPFLPRRDWISSLTFEHAVGNARAAGMLKDIGLGSKPEAYNTSLALYFLGYVLFEIPANIVYVLIAFIDAPRGNVRLLRKIGRADFPNITQAQEVQPKGVVTDPLCGLGSYCDVTGHRTRRDRILYCEIFHGSQR